MMVSMETREGSLSTSDGSHSSMLAKPRMARWSLLTGLMFYGIAQAQDAGYYEAPAFTPPAVARIEVDISSRKSDAGVDEDCSGFVITPQLARQFFSHAQAVSEHRRMHELDWSACHAEGRVKFVDGRSGSWMIARYGVGALTLSSGRFKDRTIFLHCARCEEWNR